MRNKLGITFVLVLCVVAGVSVGCGVEETSQVKDVKMIVAKFNRVGYDRYGRPLSGDNTNSINGVLANNEINKYDKSTTKDGHYPRVIIDENGSIFFIDEKDTKTFRGKVEDTFLYRKFKEKSFWGEGVVRINTLDKPWIKNGRYIQGVFHHKIADSVENSEWVEVENPNNELIFVFHEPEENSTDVEQDGGIFFPWQEEGESLWQEEDNDKTSSKNKAYIATRLAPVGYSLGDMEIYPDKIREFEVGGTYTGFGRSAPVPPYNLIFRDKNFNHIIKNSEGDVFWTEPKQVHISPEEELYWVTFEIDKNKRDQVTEIRSFQDVDEHKEFFIAGIRCIIYPRDSYGEKEHPPFIAGISKETANECMVSSSNVEYMESFEIDGDTIKPKECFSTSDTTPFPSFYKVD
ncbi:MAG: hypothetical protein R2883_00730 [Caldisericia bacterium]